MKQWVSSKCTYTHQSVRRPHDVHIKVIGDGHVEELLKGRSDWCHDFGDGARPNTRLGRHFQLPCARARYGTKSWAPQTDLVVDHLVVLVILFQGGGKLHNIRVLRVAVLWSASDI